ncbi:Roundabout 1 [Sparganum proliferum]
MVGLCSSPYVKKEEKVVSHRDVFLPPRGDTFSLEILMTTSRGKQVSLVLLEVWQFRLNIEDHLLRCGVPCSKVVANHSGLQPVISSLSSPQSVETGGTTGAPGAAAAAAAAAAADCAVVAVEDFRRSRLFERLGTLLKTVISTTRLLPGDTFSLEILMTTSRGKQVSLVLLEVWQFRLNIEDHLLRCGVPCSKVVANHSGLQPVISSLSSPQSVETGGTTGAPGAAAAAAAAAAADCAVVAVEDFRRSRLFERLGTLLKTVISTTRLLPAYGYSRRQQIDNYQMFYIIRRGEVDLEGLGSDVVCRQVGHLFPGLAMPADSLRASSPTAATSPNTLLPIFLNVSVRYRALTHPLLPLEPASDAAEQSANSTPSRGRQVGMHPGSPTEALLKGFRRLAVGPPGGQQSNWVRPVLSANADELESDYNIDAIGQLVRGPKAGLTLNEDQEEEEEEDYPDDEEDESASLEGDDNGSGDEGNLADGDGTDPTWPLEGGGADGGGGGGVGQNDSKMSQTFTARRMPDESPLQLPFSTVGISGARLTNLFAELRKKTDLDLFQVPSGAGGTATSVCNGGGGKLFDADALADELERHERTLREFDDFLTDFTSSSVAVGMSEAVGSAAGPRSGSGPSLRQVQPAYGEDIANMGDLY